MYLSIIFPVHNEEGNLEELIGRTRNTLRNYFNITDFRNPVSLFELILVDDASTDRSLEILQRYKESADIQVIHHDASRGQTGAFKSGFDAARGDVVITMDADLEVLPEDLTLFLEKMKEGYEMVNGVRMDRKHEGLIKIQSKIYNRLVHFMFRSPFRDNASNYTAFEARYIKNLPLTDNDHRYLYPILRTRGLKKWAEVEIRHELRKKGVSKYGRFKSIKGAFEILPAWLRIHGGRYRFRRLA